MSLIAISLIALAPLAPQWDPLVKEGRSLPDYPIKYHPYNNLLPAPQTKDYKDLSATDFTPTGISVLVFEGLRDLYNTNRNEMHPFRGSIMVLVMKDTTRASLESVLNTAVTTHTKKNLRVQWNIIHGPRIEGGVDSISWCYDKYRKAYPQILYRYTEPSSWTKTFGITNNNLDGDDNVIYICEGKRVVKILKNVPFTTEGAQTVKAEVDKVCNQFRVKSN